MTADLDGLPFDIVRRGFDRVQVEERFGKLLAERDAAHTARQHAVADREQLSRELDISRGETRAARAELVETRAEVDRLASKVAELSTIPSTVDGMSDRLQQMVRAAQDEVNDMRARATRGAAQILGMAQAEADELRESARQERHTFEAEQRSAQEDLQARLEETRTQLAALREEAEGRRARLDAELAERRTRDEQALAAELADRREVMLADLAAQEKRQREEAQRIVDAASARARTLVADAAAETDRARSHTREQVVRANEELEQLRALQHQVAEQLVGVRSLLDWTLPRITPAAAAMVGEAVPPVASPGPGSPALDGDDRRALDEPALEPRRLDATSAPAGRGPDVAVSDATVLDAAASTGTAPSTATAASTARAPEGTDRAAGTRPHPEPAATAATTAATMEPAARVPRSLGTEKVQVEAARPSPVSRSGQRAGARR
jgi:cell division septum initiation protein DivIVA